MEKFILKFNPSVLNVNDILITELIKHCRQADLSVLPTKARANLGCAVITLKNKKSNLIKPS